MDGGGLANVRRRAKRYDLVVIGAGAAGLLAADFAARLGVRVAIVEKDRIGGDCTWTGCMPSKALVRVARAAHQVRTAGAYGIRAEEPCADMPAVRDYLRTAIARVYRSTTPEALNEKGIDVISGAARFVNSNTIMVGESILPAKRVLISTGACPVTPPIEGLSEVPFFTYETIFDNDRLPRSLVVIGGGPLGSEIAQAYRRLGSQVTIVAPRLLPKEDDDVRAIIARTFDHEGIRLVLGRALSAQQDGDEVVVTSDTGSACGDMVLVAAGRTANLKDLDLDKAGVQHTDRGIMVDQRFQTNVKSIFAAGDVVGGAQFSHFAAWQAFFAARNALLPLRRKRPAPAIPRVTFTDPEVAHVGPSVEAARATYRDDLVVRTTPAASIDRAVTENDNEGFVRLLTRRDGTIIGATIVASRAGEALAELALAVSQEMSVAQLATAVHPYPTYSTAVQQLAADLSVKRSLGSLPGRIASRLASALG